jgi:glycosyltransferase involved in cell wall biosynthesis
MPKLLFCGDAMAATGFARVTHGLLDNLSHDWDVHVLAINYYGDPHGHRYRLYPAYSGGDVYGFGRMKELVRKIQPDMVVILNDIWICRKLAEQIPEDYDGRIILYFPIDSKNFCQPLVENLERYELVTYTQFAVNVLREAGVTQPIKVLPHGVDTNVFYPVNKSQARRVGKGIGEEDFIVLNPNRNQPRKRIDLTIQGFCRFAADKPDARLYLHMGKKDLGWDIEMLFTMEAQRHGFDPKGRLITSGDLDVGAGGLPVDILNAVYNVADCHINTSEGEGWGLTSHEGAACRIPQIVPAHSACQELFSDCGVIMPVAQERYDMETLRVWGVVWPESVTRALDWVYHNRDQSQSLSTKAYYKLTNYTWDKVAQQFEAILLG